jgi:hypothetical protein
MGCDELRGCFLLGPVDAHRLLQMIGTSPPESLVAWSGRYKEAGPLLSRAKRNRSYQEFTIFLRTAEMGSASVSRLCASHGYKKVFKRLPATEQA